MTELSKGIEIVTQATEHDLNQRTKEACYLYELALQYFQKALQIETNQETKTLIAQKMKDYQTRLQQLQPTSSPASFPPVLSSPASSSQITNIQKVVMTAPPQIDWSSLQIQEKAKWRTYEETSSNLEEVVSDLKKAIGLVEEATAQDNAGSWQQALSLYQSALDYFLRALEAEKNAEIKKAITDKMTQYIERAEQIKEGLAPKKKKSTISKLEVSPAAAQHVSAAINFATEATDEDECGRFTQAIPKYEQAISNFSLALKVETNEGVKSMMKERMIEYNARVEQLKQFEKKRAVLCQVQFHLA